MQQLYSGLLAAALLPATPLLAAPTAAATAAEPHRAVVEQPISGVVTNDAGQPMPGATIFLRGTFIGTSTDQFGKFVLNADFAGGPVVLDVAFVGYDNQLITVTQASDAVQVQLKRSVNLLTDLVVAASRVEESILSAPVTIDKVTTRDLERISTPEVMGGLGKLPGIDVSSTSMLFTSISTRGFNTAKSERVVQLVDYMDTALPSLNLSPGNLVGIPELDMESVEIIHGPASALYGSNALSGVVLFNTKDPFVYEGLSVRLRAGQRNLLDGQLRYARKIGKRFAFKINASGLRASDWVPTDYQAQGGSTNPAGSPLGYDAINRYGELQATFSPLLPGSNPELYGKTVTMPGYNERQLLAGDTLTTSYRLQGTASYLLKDDLKLTVEVKRAEGSATYQNISRFRVKGLGTDQLRAELKGSKGFVRAYHTEDFTGTTYELTQLAGLLYKSPSDLNPSTSYRNVYFFAYNQAYTQARQAGMQPNAALAAAQQAADATLKGIAPGTPRFADVRSQIIGEDQPGKGSRQYFNSSLSDVSAQRSFSLGEKAPELTVGGAYRAYLLGSEGKLFADTDGKRIGNYEYGAYVQLIQGLLDERLKLSGTARLDLFKNFNAALSPRVAAVYSAGATKQHNFRVSYGRAFRSPSQTDQYLRSDVGDYIFLGNVTNGFRGYQFTDANGNAYFPGLSPSTAPFEVSFDKLRLERVGTVEVGYKGAVLPRVYLDASYFRSQYQDFIGVSYLVSGEDGTMPTKQQFDAGFTNGFSTPAARIISVSRNNDQEVRTQGATVGLTYYLNRALNLTGNYSLNVIDRSNLPAGFRTFFNTPKHKYNVGVNGFVLKNLSYSVNYRWVQGHLQEMPFATGTISDFSSTDAYFGYLIPKLGTTVQVGGSNLFNSNNIQVIGAPQLGRLVFAGLLVELK